MKSIHYIIYMAFAALSFTACQEEELFADYGEGTGTLTLSGIEVVSEVGDIQTRASMSDADIPSADEFTIELVNAETEETKTLELNASYQLEAGSYIVRASYGKEGVMSYTPYFMDEEEIVISNGDTKTIRLKPSLQNAIIHPKMTETLISQYKNYKLSVAKDDGEGIELENDKDFYVPVEEGTYTLTLAGTNVLDESVSYDWEYQGSQFVAQTRYIVNCNPDLPSFTLPTQAETNAWSEFVYITPMTAENISYKPDGLTDEEILANVKYEVSTDEQSWTQAVEENGKWVVKGLLPGTSYKLRANFFEVYSNIAEVTTENGAGVPNGDFEELTETINISGMNQGGGWNASTGGDIHQNTCSFIIQEPDQWASVNSKTCDDNASNKNSWFIIPSTYNTSLKWQGTVPNYHYWGSDWGGGGTETPAIYQNLSAQNGTNAMIIRNVAWDVNGSSPSDDKRSGFNAYGRDDYYNHNIPNIANRSAGKLFLGSYTYSNGTETYDEGIEFASRPISLKGYYKYVQDGNDTNEMGTVTVSLLNGETVIGSGNTALGVASDYTEFDIPIHYTDESQKATELRIMITSSNHASYNQEEETASIKTTNYNGRYESASRGAMLTVDNLTFSYAYPSNNE